jgi:hypothetical protein
VLLPRIRATPAETLVLANGFSCREQIEQCTGRRTLHVASVGRSIDLDRRGANDLGVHLACRLRPRLATC